MVLNHDYSIISTINTRVQECVDDAALSRDAYAMSHLSAVNLALKCLRTRAGWVCRRTRCCCDRPTIYICGGGVVPIHDADRPSLSAALAVVQPAECE